MATSNVVDRAAPTGSSSTALEGHRSAQPPVITNISIERLFGRYSYSIPEHPIGALPGEYDRLILLYGDNGSGKTTILNLVYHLLSPMDRRGHRTFIADTPFARFSVALGDGRAISVHRDGGEIKGSYKIMIENQGKKIDEIPMNVDSDGRIDPADQRHSRYLRYVESLNIFPYYLTENRSFTSDMLNEDDDDMSSIHLRYVRMYKDTLSRSNRDDLYTTFPDELPRSMRQGQELLIAVDRAQRWLQHQAYSGTSTGLANASSVYLDVLEHLTTATDPQETSPDGKSTSVRERLQTLAQRSSEYARFELGTPFPAHQFLQLLNQAPPDRRRLLENALVPHLDSSEAQLDALQELYRLLVIFTTAINSFFTDKILRFSARGEGISIHAMDHERLEPSELSSGERQLLLLLCNTLVAREDSRLFIIDQPEISLSVKWQRQLLDVLLACTAGTSLQFLVATHSVEMVAGHRESMARLVNERAS